MRIAAGKSWGKLSKPQQKKFELLNCNSIGSRGANPSCDDQWGANHVNNWMKNRNDEIHCDVGKTSTVNCYKNENNGQYCEITNAQINFNRFEDIKRSGLSDSKKFQQDFLSSDCSDSKTSESTFNFPHLYSPKLSSQKCDVSVSGTTLLYSHDNVKNLGHFFNDVMDVWLMLYLSRNARNTHRITFLTVDALKQYNNFHDEISAFFAIYKLNFKQLLRGKDYGRKTVCFEKLLIQPHPARGFVWDSWHQNTGAQSIFDYYCNCYCVC